MIRRKLCNWFSKIAIGEHPAMPALAQRPASRPRRTFVGGCRCVALVLIVFTGMRKSCCGDCRLPDQASFSVSSLTFTPQVPNPAGPASAPQSVTLTATGEAGSSLSISSITASSDFSETNDCPASLATQSSCTIQVSFSPNSVGVIQGQLVLDGTSGVQLSGTGIAPVTFSPASLDFGTVDPGTTGTAQTVTLTNNQASALAITGISTGGDYAETNNCPASLGAGATCTIQTTFSPTVSGLVPGAIAVVTDATLGTQPVGLTGTGSGALTATLSFSPASLTFANQEAGTSSSARTVTVTNTSGVLSLTINSVASSGSNFIETDNCSGQVLAPAGSCTINVTFQPAANLVPISYAGVITVNDTDSTSPNVVGLSGLGVAPVTPFPASVDFGTIYYNNAPSQSMTVTNNDAAAEDVMIDAPAGFALNNNTCPASLSPGGQCTFNLQYQGGLGSFQGSVGITTSAGGFLSPSTANVSACGTELQWSPSGFNFGNPAVGSSSAPETLTINNGDNRLVGAFSNISISGANAGDFSIGSNTCSASLAGGESCLVTVVFTPKSSGPRSAALTLTDNANCSPQQITLSGGSLAGPFILTASTVGSATGTITSDVAGITCGTNGSSCSASFASGSQVTLMATPDSGTVFSGWLGACSGTGPCVLNMSADKQVMAIFGTNPVLSVSSTLINAGAGSVTSSPTGINCGTSCSQSFAPETEVTLTPHPAAGSLFVGWTGGCEGTGACSITMLTNQTVSAQFASPSFSVTATSPTPASIGAGQSATSMITVSSQYGFKSPISFTCSVQPQVTVPPTCSLADITPPSDGTASGTLTIKTEAPSTTLGLLPKHWSGIFFAAWIAGFGFLGTLVAGRPKSRQPVLTILCLCLLGGLFFEPACGGNSSSVLTNVGSPGTPAGNYTISIVGTAGSVQVSSSPVTLTVE